MTDTIYMTFDEWIDDFKPLQNPIEDNASFDGIMFDISEEELAYLCQQDMAHIWTITDQDGVLCVSEGMRFINRLGYAVTAKPHAENTFYVIVDDD